MTGKLCGLFSLLFSRLKTPFSKIPYLYSLIVSSSDRLIKVKWNCFFFSRNKIIVRFVWIMQTVYFSEKGKTTMNWCGRFFDWFDFVSVSNCKVIVFCLLDALSNLNWFKKKNKKAATFWFFFFALFWILKIRRQCSLNKHKRVPTAFRERNFFACYVSIVWCVQN